MTENNRWRKPSWLSVIATIVGVFFLCSLGVWQLQRAEEKRLIQQENESHKNNPPQTLNFPITEPTSLRFNRIRLQGQFISSKQFVLDNQVLEHQVGYNILTPFQLHDSEKIVLIDRGWLPLIGSREQLPEVEVGEEMRTLIGMVYVPYGEAYSLGEIDSTKTWPRLIQFLDFKALELRLGEPLLPLTLRMEANQKDAFKAQWILFTATPKRHLGYAVQWFALALTLLILFIVLHIPKSTKETNEKSN